jgi:hypothetical protein
MLVGKEYFDISIMSIGKTRLLDIKILTPVG